MNFSKRKEPPNLSRVLARLENEVQDEVENQRLVPRAVSDYAPPSVREVRDVVRREAPAPFERIMSFAELPTKALDDQIAALKTGVANAEKETQDLRDVYMKHYTRLQDEAKRLAQHLTLTEQMLKAMRDQQRQLDEPDDDPKDAA